MSNKNAHITGMKHLQIVKTNYSKLDNEIYLDVFM